MEIEGGKSYLTRNSSRANVWYWDKNGLGEECWVGTIAGAGYTCWDKDGRELDGETEWDIVAPAKEGE